MFTSLYRIIKYGVQNFLRSSWLSAVTVIMMILGLIVFQSLIIFNVVTSSAVKSLQDKIDICVYFEPDAPEDDILLLKNDLENLPEVKRVGYISKEQALVKFKSRHAEEKIVMQALSELEENPLLASLEIKAFNPEDYQNIAKYLENANYPIIKKITYTQNQLIIDRLIKITDVINKGGITITIGLAIIAFLVTFNTIRLGIYSNRRKIEIMRLVGAPNSFIRGPFVVQGILCGALAAVLSFSFFSPLISLASPYVTAFIPQVNLQNYLQNNYFTLFGWQLITGIGLGIFSSAFAVKKYLKI